MGHWENHPTGSPFGPLDNWVLVEDAQSKTYIGHTSHYPVNSRPPILRSLILGCLEIFVIGMLVVVSITAFAEFTTWVQNNSLKITFSVGSTWDGDEFQYDHASYNSGHTDMILTIDSIKKGSWLGKVHWPHVGDTVTKAEGIIVAKVNTKDIHWKYVASCSKGKYLQFTETKYIQNSGSGIILNAKYYAVVCDGTLSGVWFYPDQPSGYPGGEFSLQWNFPGSG
jgi:hypothetical protein